MRKKVLLYLWGQALLVLALGMLVPLCLSVYIDENRLAGFGIPVLISLVLSYKFTKGVTPYNGRLSIREGAALIGIGFLTFCFIGMLPFWLKGYPFIDALFESVSGFTTTGASVLGNLNYVELDLMLWRSISQWLGGLGIVLIFITLVPQVGKNAAGLFIGEIYGESAERMLPKMGEIVRVLFSLYVAFTALVLAALKLAGMSFFEALNYAMTMVSSGGFSLYNEGLGHFQNPWIYAIALVTMFIAGGNYVLYFRFYKDSHLKLWDDSEFKGYIILVLLGTVLIGYNLIYCGVYGWSDSMVAALAQVISICSTTGFVMADYPQWSDFSKLILFCLMFVGGCSGSAAGGLKISRLVILLKTTWVELKRTLHPSMITNIVLSGINVSASLNGTIFRFFFLYTLTFFLSATLLALVDELSMFGAAGVALSCLSGAGTSFEVVCGVSGYSALSSAAKVIAIITMLLGRLEIFSLCVLFYPAFWEKGK